ncbi:hypothetical protein C1H46_007255 [Malus baccata]|uniref:Uncharacterized protein n=1 Tax=Malus baccata TaxID=106549 RepID=A0A540N825_MALBA|nr:hypothetical protein C1H46_007255 [Malus baccata]
MGPHRLSVFIIFLTYVRSVLISALAIGGVVVFVQGAFKVHEDLFLDEQEPSASISFISLLNGVAPHVVVGTSPAVIAARG